MKLRKRKQVGTLTRFPALELYSKLLNDEISLEEFANAENLDPVDEPIFEDEIEE